MMYVTIGLQLNKIQIEFITYVNINDNTNASTHKKNTQTVVTRILNSL